MDATPELDHSTRKPIGERAQDNAALSSFSLPISGLPPFVIWLTGMPSSGKTTIANALKPKLKEFGLNAEVLDGDIMRRELSPDLGFTKQDRYAHVKKVIFICNLLSNNGTVSIVSAVSPDKEVRDFVRSKVHNFVEIYVKCSLSTRIKRDCKGLYKRALTGKMDNLIGLQDPYEEPINPELTVNTETENLDYITSSIILKLQDLGYITSPSTGNGKAKN
jgi:adenylylsulfate kinase